MKLQSLNWAYSALKLAAGGLCLLAGSTITASANAVGFEDQVIASIDGKRLIGNKLTRAFLLRF